MDSIGSTILIYFFLSKIYTCKIENQPNIEAIEKNHTKINYVTQLTIN